MTKVMSIAALVLSVIAIGPTLGTSAEPKAAPPAVVVLTSCPGLLAPAVEKAITNRIERWVSQAPGMRRVESRSLAGLSMVTVTFEIGSDPSRVLTVVSSLALGTLPNLPPGTLAPIVLPYDPAAWTPVGLVVVQDPSRQEIALTEIARLDVRNGLGGVPGVIAPVVMGGRDRVLLSVLDPDKLRLYNVSALDVARVFQDAGFAPTVIGNQLLLDAATPADKLKNLADMPIRKENVFLRDVGTVEDAAAPRQSLVRVDGRRVVCVPVFTAQGTDPKAVREAVQKAIPKIETRLPKGIRLGFHSFGGRADLLTIRMQAPSGSRLEITEKRVADIERLVTDQLPAEDRTMVFSDIGMRPIWSALCTSNVDEQDATIWVPISAKGKRSAAEYATLLQRKAAEDKRVVDLRLAFSVAGAPALKVRISGGTPEQATKIATEVRRRLARMPELVDVHEAGRLDEPALVFEVDRDKAALVGLSSREVVAQLAIALKVAAPPKPDANGTGYTVPVAQLSPNTVSKLDEILKVGVFTGTNQQGPVAFGALVKVRRGTVPVEIVHVDGKRVFTVYAGIAGRDAAASTAAARKAIGEIQVPGGVAVEID